MSIFEIINIRHSAKPCLRWVNLMTVVDPQVQYCERGIFLKRQRKIMKNFSHDIH
jgi:hypothetical protein